jgi:microcystin-dependent protein
VAGNLLLGTETIDASGNAIDSDSNIKFTLNKIPFSIPLQKLSFLQNVSSDLQTQINNISTTGSGTITTLEYITQALSDNSSTQYGNRAYNKTATGFSNTAIGSNTLYNVTSGSYNTSVGFISLQANTTGVGNTAVGYHALGRNTTGNSNTCIGLGAGSNNTIGNNNVAIGNYAGLSLVNVTGSTCIGTTSDTSFNYSTAIGCNAVCTSQYQVMLGTSSDTVVVPNNLQVNGSINTVSKTVFSYLANCTSDIQQQLTALKSPVTDITWISGVFNTTNIANVCQTNILKFSGSINNISANTFGFLTGLTSNVQNQINNISNTTPIGSVIQFAGNSSSLPGYLLCDGSEYPIPSYVALFNVIQYTYGGDQATGFFKVPNYQGIFLRGSGSQNVNLNAIAGSNTAVQKTYTSPSLGTIFPDESAQITTSNYVNGINQTVKSFITSANAFGPPNYNFNYSNAVASMNYTTGSDTLNIGHTETFPAHTSIQYFIKY